MISFCGKGFEAGITFFIHYISTKLKMCIASLLLREHHVGAGKRRARYMQIGHHHQANNEARREGRCGQQYVSIMPAGAAKQVSHAAAPVFGAMATSQGVQHCQSHWLHVSCCRAACHRAGGAPARAIMPGPAASYKSGELRRRHPAARAKASSSSAR